MAGIARHVLRVGALPPIGQHLRVLVACMMLLNHSNRLPLLLQLMTLSYLWEVLIAGNYGRSVQQVRRIILMATASGWQHRRNRGVFRRSHYLLIRLGIRRQILSDNSILARMQFWIP